MRGIPLILPEKRLISLMKVGQKARFSRCCLMLSGARRMKFWWRLVNFIVRPFRLVAERLPEKGRRGKSDFR
jgi:hypothetical protein